MSKRNTNTILLVEDDIILRDMYKLKIELAGYRVVACDDAYKALKYLAKYRPKLAVIDIMLPKMNGLKLIKTIRQDNRHDDMKIIILTNLTQSDVNLHDTIRESLAVSDYFVKSQTSPQQLMHAIQALI